MRCQPRHQLAIPDLGRSERFDAEHTTDMIHHGSHMGVGMSVDATNHSIRVGSYDGHSYPSSLDGQGWHALAGKVDHRPPGPGFSRTGNGSPTRPVSAVPRARRRVIRKTTTEGVSRFVSQTQPRELTNRRLKPLVTAIHLDQRTNTSSLPVMGGLGAVLGGSDGCILVD
jgi:hypothetical protein